MSGLYDKNLVKDIKNDFGIELYDYNGDRNNKLLLIFGLGTTTLVAIFIGPMVAIGSGIGTLVYYFKK
jgi:hypothetical protein